jgi:HEAT repeat protein
VLKGAEEPEPVRLAAADALGLLVEASADRLRSATVTVLDSERFLEIGKQALRAVAGDELGGQPVSVRRRCLDVCRTISSEMAEIITQQQGGYTAALPVLRDRLPELAEAFYRQVGPLAEAAQDPDVPTRLQALRVLNDLAIVRNAFRPRKEPIPLPEPIPPPKKEGDKERTWGGPRPAAVVAVAFRPAADEPPKRTPAEAEAALRKTRASAVRGLSDPEVNVRRAAADLLEALGPDAVGDADALIRAMHDPDKFVRWTAARAVANLAPGLSDGQAAAAVAGLDDLLSDQELALRLAAAGGLQSFGKRAAAAAPKLTRTINRSQTQAALAIVPTRDTDPGLVSGDPDIRIAAMHALEAVGGDAMVQALPAVRVALLDQRTAERVREAAAGVLGRQGGLASAALRIDLIAGLGEALRDPDPAVRRAAAEALLSLTEK